MDKHTKAWRERNPERHKEQTDRANKKRRTERPWLMRYYAAKARCTNPHTLYYHRYGGRGIKFNMTQDEFYSLWVRDSASKMKRPNIDRIDNDGNYELSNCRFIEQKENTARNRKTHCHRGHPFSGDNLKFNRKGEKRCVACEKINNELRKALEMKQ